jgi:hypothetical protein
MPASFFRRAWAAFVRKEQGNMAFGNTEGNVEFWTWEVVLDRHGRDRRRAYFVII